MGRASPFRQYPWLCPNTIWRSSPAVSVVVSQHDGGDPFRQYPWLCPNTMGEIRSSSIRGCVPARWGRSSPAASVVVSQHDREIRSGSIRGCVLTRKGDPVRQYPWLCSNTIGRSIPFRQLCPNTIGRSSPAVSVVVPQHDGGDPVHVQSGSFGWHTNVTRASGRYANGRYADT